MSENRAGVYNYTEMSVSNTCLDTIHPSVTVKDNSSKIIFLMFKSSPMSFASSHVMHSSFNTKASLCV